MLSICVLALAGCGGEPGNPEPLAIYGHTGAGPGGFNYPRAAVIGYADRLYVVDKGGRIQAFTQEGQFVLDWRMPAIDAGKPTGLGVAADGRVFAADTHYSRVVVFSPQGELLGTVGSAGEGPGQFRLPTDVAVDSRGFIYVSEYGGNDRISKFTPDWQFVTSFGGPDAGPARQKRPQAIRIAPDDTLWVADSCNHRICRFDADGRLLTAFGRPGDGPGELRFPYGLDLLSDGSLVVCEYGNNRLQRFSPDGRSLGTWGRPGRGPGQLAYPWSLVVGAEDRIFVIDSGNNRVQVLEGLAAGTWQDPQAVTASESLSRR